MGRTKVSDEEFIALFQKFGPTKLAQIIEISVRNVHDRRARLELTYGQPIKGPEHPAQTERRASDILTRLPMDIQSGVVLVGSDAHYWPDVISPAHRAYLYLAKELQPVMTLLNGDVFDGAKASRHPPIGWAKAPDLQAEVEAVDERLTEIREAAPKARRIWTRGNHDMRFESTLANVAPQFVRVKGFRLSDHFPEWEMCWSVWINDNVVIKHRFKGGIHATHNNTLYAGRTMVTGHLHSLKVTPFSDYNGTRFGVDTGTLADPYGEHADYSEDNPLNHRSGGVVLTFHAGKLLWPEPFHVLDQDHFEFRGKVIKV